MSQHPGTLLFSGQSFYSAVPFHGKSRASVPSSFWSFLIRHLLRQTGVLGTLQNTATPASAQLELVPSITLSVALLNLLRNSHSAHVPSCLLTCFPPFPVRGNLAGRTALGLLMTMFPVSRATTVPQFPPPTCFSFLLLSIPFLPALSVQNQLTH